MPHPLGDYKMDYVDNNPFLHTQKYTPWKLNFLKEGRNSEGALQRTGVTPRRVDGRLQPCCTGWCNRPRTGSSHTKAISEIENWWTLEQGKGPCWAPYWWHQAAIAGEGAINAGSMGEDGTCCVGDEQRPGRCGRSVTSKHVIALRCGLFRRPGYAGFCVRSRRDLQSSLGLDVDTALIFAKQIRARQKRMLG